MNKWIKFAALALITLMLFVPTRSASAAGTDVSSPFDGKIVVGDSYTLESGETLVGDLVVVGGEATIEEDATVEGSVALIGGSLIINGNVRLDVAVIGGTVTLGDTAHVYGDLAAVGSTFTRAETARVDGSVVNNTTSWTGDFPEVTDVPVVPTQPEIIVPQIIADFHPLRDMFNVFSQAFGFALIAALLMLFMVPQVERVARAVVSQPLNAGGLGLLTLVLAPLAMVLLSITLILIPAAILLGFVLGIAFAFGWIAMGYELGVRITHAFKWNWHPSFSAGLGTFVLSIGASLLTLVPVLNCMGGVVVFLVSMAGLGAVIMTRFGSRAVIPPVTVVAPPAAPAPVE